MERNTSRKAKPIGPFADWRDLLIQHIAEQSGKRDELMSKYQLLQAKRKLLDRMRASDSLEVSGGRLFAARRRMRAIYSLPASRIRPGMIGEAIAEFEAALQAVKRSAANSD